MTGMAARHQLAAVTWGLAPESLSLTWLGDGAVAADVDSAVGWRGPGAAAGAAVGAAAVCCLIRPRSISPAVGRWLAAAAELLTLPREPRQAPEAERAPMVAVAPTLLLRGAAAQRSTPGAAGTARSEAPPAPPSPPASPARASAPSPLSPPRPPSTPSVHSAAPLSSIGAAPAAEAAAPRHTPAAQAAAAAAERPAGRGSFRTAVSRASASSARSPVSLPSEVASPRPGGHPRPQPQASSPSGSRRPGSPTVNRILPRTGRDTPISSGARLSTASARSSGARH
eukprot:TRINITY_DN10407_c0_g1_i1.p1 TRINITY_DN10407_c0_g1~~TRINITY_DN10407_c0_g1_i1.p1  ORF type:complete len:284 (+),score=21.83 TRINITY_DN10407_c0_g1_i1:78-929(+)